MDSSCVLRLYDDRSNRRSREHCNTGDCYHHGRSVIAYIIGEGLTDAANVEIGEGQLLEVNDIKDEDEQ